MFDVAPTELLLVAIVALLVIGPKDLPKAMRFVGHWAGKARGVARQFRSGFDAMVREAELTEMEQKWAEENARIMREHPVDPSAAPQAALSAPGEAGQGDPVHDGGAIDHDVAGAHAPPPGDTAPIGQFAFDDPAPVTVEQPVVRPAFSDDPAPASDKAPS